MLRFRLISIIAFFTLILAPTLHHYVPFIVIDPINEDRKKEEWPEGSMLRGLIFAPGFGKAIEDYYLDHFPLRDLALRGLGQLEYSILNYSQEVVVGKDGWLSDKKVIADQIHELDKVSDDRVKGGILLLKRLQHFLNKDGADLLVVIVPMKPSIYGEQFPEKYSDRPEKTGLERFQLAMHDNGIPFIDLLNLFRVRKEYLQLYYKTDMHWNTVGSALASELIVNSLSQDMFGTRIWDADINKSTYLFKGQELATMPVFFPKPETTPVWSVKLEASKNVVDSYPTPLTTLTVDGDKGQLLPPLIMFGNSFMLNYESTGLYNYFEEAAGVLDYQHFKQVLDYVKPHHRTVVLHIYETQLLFHVLPPDLYNYWDPRVGNLPLPDDFEFVSSGK